MHFEIYGWLLFIKINFIRCAQKWSFLHPQLIITISGQRIISDGKQVRVCRELTGGFECDVANRTPPFPLAARSRIGSSLPALWECERGQTPHYPINEWSTEPSSPDSSLLQRQRERGAAASERLTELRRTPTAFQGFNAHNATPRPVLYDLVVCVSCLFIFIY